MKKEFEIKCTGHNSGLHEFGIIKRWSASDWYYCPVCQKLFDDNLKVCEFNSTPKEVLEVVLRIEKQIQSPLQENEMEVFINKLLGSNSG